MSDNDIIRKIMRNHPDWNNDQVREAWVDVRDRQVGQPSGHPVAIVLGVVLVLLGLWAGYRVLHAEAVKGNPPAACQILGGQWSIWSGWQCA